MGNLLGTLINVCGYVDCEEVISAHAEYCSKHRCRWTGCQGLVRCTNFDELDRDYILYCDKHGCSTTPIHFVEDRTKTPYCRDCRCQAPNCQERKKNVKLDVISKKKNYDDIKGFYCDKHSCKTTSKHFVEDRTKTPYCQNCRCKACNCQKPKIDAWKLKNNSDSDDDEYEYTVCQRHLGQIIDNC